LTFMITAFIIDNMKRKISLGKILAGIWIVILVVGGAWGVWGEIREKGWIILVAPAGAIFITIIFYRASKERDRKKRETKRLKEALYIISSDAEEEKIREIADKVLFDEEYDPLAEKQKRKVEEAEEELLNEFGSEELENLLESMKKKD